MHLEYNRGLMPIGKALEEKTRPVPIIADFTLIELRVLAHMQKQEKRNEH